MITPFEDKNPDIGEEVFIAPDAWIIGDVKIGAKSSVFFGAVLRGDILGIEIGERTNIQEHCLLHTSRRRVPTILKDEVTVGHRAIIHGATVEECCIIGMGSILLDEAIIGEGCVVGAGTVVTEGKKFPPRSLVLGTPGKVIRTLEDSEIAFIRESSVSYVEKARAYREMGLG